MSLCVLDEESFYCCCQLFLQQSEQLRDGWSWEAVQGSEEGYLRKATLRSVVIDSSPLWDQEGSSSDSEPHTSSQSWPDQLGQDKDQAVCVSLADADCIKEGRSLSLEEVWSSVHPNFRLRLKKSPLNTITLQEHPLLGQPFFMLHPCRTEEFMRPVVQAAQSQQRPLNYVLSWLSVVGPVVGLDVPLKYSTQVRPAASQNNTEPD